MPTFYLVDRYNRYRPNQTVNLKSCSQNLPSDLMQVANRFFPNGVSPQGEHYFFNHLHMGVNELSMDWEFEMFRRAMHPNRPSRWESIFASETLHEAKTFRSRLGNPGNPIFEISVSNANYHRCDMALLNRAVSPLRYTQYADHYWMGTTFTPSNVPNWVPTWEILLPLPVTIGNQVP